MLPILLGVAVVALFAGCTSSQEANNNTDSSPPPETAPEETQGPEAPPPPQAPIPLQLEFNESSKAFAVYQQIKEAKVKDEDLDQGVPFTDYSQNGPALSYSGKGDGKLSEREVYEYVFNHYDQYQKTIEGMIGKPAGWILDDLDPKTEFDEKIRQRVSEASQDLVAALKAQGLNENSPEYREKLAVGLFYFVDFPSDPKKFKNKEKELRTKTQELETLGLKSFRDRLFEMGGLGVSEIKFDGPHESSALSALKSKTGGITEKCKILFAVLETAGLKPFFARARVTEIEPNFKGKGFYIPWQNRQDFHTFIGIPLGEKNRYFDLNYFQSNAGYPNVYPLTLSQVAAGEMNQQGFEGFLSGKPESALAAFQGAIYLDPNYPITYNNFGNLLAGVKKFPEAKKLLETSTQLDPQFALAFMNLGNIALYEDQVDKAFSLYEKARKLDPKYPMTYSNLAVVYLQKKKYDLAVKFAKEALRMDPKNPMFQHNLDLATAAENDASN
jgi:tetratricopeptide (TPR) repeat protein